MSEAISIRVAEEQDAESIAEAEYTTAATRGLLNALPGEIPLEAFREKIRALAAHPDGIYLVAQSGGQQGISGRPEHSRQNFNRKVPAPFHQISLQIL